MSNESSILALTSLLFLACSTGGRPSNAGGSGALAVGGALGAAESEGTAAAGASLAPAAPPLRGTPSAEGTGGAATVAPRQTERGDAEDAGDAGSSRAAEWLPSWATTIQVTEPNNLPPPLANNTLRQFVWPTVPGEQIRIQLSNEKGSSPVELQKVHIALAMTSDDPGDSGGAIDGSTDATFTFQGVEAVTIAPGETVWSDALDFPLQAIRLTAISMQFGGAVPTAITGHPGSRTTSYVAEGDAVGRSALPDAQTRDRWYFINALEVMAPSEAYAIAVLGDSITDGYGVLNRFARWPDFMTLAIQSDPRIADQRAVLNFGMGANLLTSSSSYQDAGVIRFERDVLTRDKIKWLIVLEGVNDVNGNVQAQPIIDAYREIIQKARAKGILVYGSPITPNGAAGVRATVNEWIRTSGEFDQVIDFDAIIRDPNDPNDMLPMYDNDGLHPSIAGYEAMGNAVDLSLFYDFMSD